MTYGLLITLLNDAGDGAPQLLLNCVDRENSLCRVGTTVPVEVRDYQRVRQNMVVVEQS
jgi:hypothetical protein